MPVPVAIVGAGRLGTALLGALREAGVPVSGPHGRGFDGTGAGVVLLCVPDDAIAAAADAVTAPVVLLGHCSGASRLDVLGDHEGFSLHPLMTVTRDGADFRGVTAAVAGRTPRSLAAASTLAGLLGLRAVQVAESDRAAYHAAAAIASNFLITLQDAAAELIATAGLDRGVLMPLARAALDNWGKVGPAALTGPVARGDTRTVDLHRDTVTQRTPDLLGLFDALVAATERLARRTATAVEVRPAVRDSTLGETVSEIRGSGDDLVQEPGRGPGSMPLPPRTAPSDPHDPRASESASP